MNHIILLQVNQLNSRLPTFSEMVWYYGPFLGLVLSLIIAMMIMQYIWYDKNVKAKAEEINRHINYEERL